MLYIGSGSTQLTRRPCQICQLCGYPVHYKFSAVLAECLAFLVILKHNRYHFYLLLGTFQVRLPLQGRATPMLKFQESFRAILEQADHKKQVLQLNAHLPHYVTPDERDVFVGCCNGSGQAIVHQGHLHPLVMLLHLVFDDDIPQLKCCADLLYTCKTSRYMYTTNGHPEHAALVRFVLADLASNSNYHDTGVRTLHKLCFQRKLLIKCVQQVFAIKVSMLARAARCL